MNVSNERLEKVASNLESDARVFRMMVPPANGSTQQCLDAAAALRAVLAVRELANEMDADDAINDAEIERANKERNLNYARELIGAKRDTRAWAKKLRAIVGADAGDGR